MLPKNLLAFTFNLVFFLFFLRQSLTLLSGWSAVARSLLTAPSAYWVQAFLLPQPPWDYRCILPCPANFVFLVEVGFFHVGQAGLELLTSSDPPASASCIAWTTGLSQRARP